MSGKAYFVIKLVNFASEETSFVSGKAYFAAKTINFETGNGSFLVENGCFVPETTSCNGGLPCLPEEQKSCVISLR